VRGLVRGLVPRRCLGRRSVPWRWRARVTRRSPGRPERRGGGGRRCRAGDGGVPPTRGDREAVTRAIVHDHEPILDPGSPGA